jgi:hypothetical protein
MVPVVMEPRCRNVSDWQGVVGGKLGGRLYIDFTSDEPATFDTAVASLIEELKQMGVAPDLRIAVMSNLAEL